MRLTQEQIKFFRKNPSKASEILLNIKLTWFQKIILETAWNKRFSLAICSRGLGKTFVAAIWLVLHCILYSEVKAAVMAKDYNYTKATFQKIQFIYDNSPFLQSITVGPPKLGKERSEILFKTKSSIIAEPFKRGRRFSIILVDEAREIDLNDLSTVIYPMLTDPHPFIENKLFLCSSATYANEPLHKLYQEYQDYIKKGNQLYGVCDFNYLDALTGPYMDEIIVENAKKIMLEEEFAIEFSNTFVNLAGGWIKGPLIRSSELDYRPELYGEPGFQYFIGVDFGRVINGDATSITVTKVVPNEGVRFVRNIAVIGMPIPDQAILIKQVWRDYGGKNRGDVIGICLDNEKLGFAVCDNLKLPSLDPRDGFELPSIVGEDDYQITGSLQLIKPVNFADTTAIYIRASKMKKGLESGLLHLPKDAYKISMSEAEKLALSHEDREIIEACEEISELKREMCNVEVQSNNSGTALTFKRSASRRDKKDRFTSAFLSASEALDYYDEISGKSNINGIGVIC
jgi:hypothetical protein